MNTANLQNIEQLPIAPSSVDRTFDKIVVYLGGVAGTPKPYAMSFEALEAVLSGLQPVDVDLSAIAKLGTTGLVERNGRGQYSTYATNPYGKSLLQAFDPSEARTKLGLAMGIDVQPYALQLTNLAELAGTGTVEKTGNASFSTYQVSEFAKSLLDDRSQLEALQTLEIVPGLHVQRHSDRLSYFASLESSGILEKVGNTYQTVNVSDYSKQLLSVAGQPEAQDVLGIKPGKTVQPYSEYLEDLADVCDRPSDGFLRKIGDKLHFVPVDAGIVDTVTLTGDRCFEIDHSTGENVAINLSFRSQPANYVLASPNGGEGALEPRPLAVADLPDLGGVYQKVTANLTAIANLKESGILKHSDGDVTVTPLGAIGESLLTAQSVDDVKKLLGVDQLEDAINGLRSLMVMLQQSMIAKK